MATVRKHRGRWVCDYRDQRGRRRIETPRGPFENAALERIAAQQLLSRRVEQVSRGDFQSDRLRLTFGELCDRYLASKVNIRATTLRSYRGLIECYLRPIFGARKLHTITLADIEQFRADLAQGIPPQIVKAFSERLRTARPALAAARAKSLQRTRGVRTINKALTVLSMVFNYAMRHRYLEFNPAEYVDRLRDPRRMDGDKNVLTPDEIRKLIEAADEPWRLLIQVAVFTGMRQGEILGLTWGDVDWNSKQLHVRRAWKEGAFTDPKTSNSQRRVDLPDFLVLELKKWKLRCPKGDYDLVFANGAGQPMSHANLLQRGFYPALRRAGLRKIRFHDLRHTFASLLLANGEDIVRVSRLLGHASPNITLCIYSHQLPKEHYGSTNRLAQLVYPSAPTVSPCSSSPRPEIQASHSR